MKQYLDTLKYVLKNGHDRVDRTKVGTRASFGLQMKFNMKDGFPAVTTKKLAFKVMKAELLWFISGSSDNKKLNELGCHIWDANGDADYWKPKAKFKGDLGRVYGVQWRDWRSTGGKHIDQLSDVIERIRSIPTDRRLVITAWNPGELDEMVLPPCHMFFQFFVAGDTLSLQMYQRSADLFLGVPFNIASYALLLHMVAQVTDLIPDQLVLTFGDIHIYKNHFDAVKEQLKRKPGKLPTLWLNPKVTSLYDFTMDDIKLLDYVSQPTIKAPMAV